MKPCSSRLAMLLQPFLPGFRATQGCGFLLATAQFLKVDPTHSTWGLQFAEYELMAIQVLRQSVDPHTIARAILLARNPELSVVDYQR